MKMPSLKFLKTFQLAAAHESFKAAADELCITPSAVSHQIKTLESQIGVALFERGPHSLSLTAAGQHYVQSLDTLFSRLEAVTEQLQLRYGRGVLRLQLPPFFASEMLMPRLQAFMDVRPNIDLHINTVSASLQAHPADVDLSIVVDAPPQSELSCYRLFEQIFVPACAPQMLKFINDLDDLNQQTLLVHEARRDGWQRWAELCGNFNLQPRNIVRFDTMHAAAEAAERGIGIALVSEPITRERFRAGTLVRLFDAELHTGESYYLILRPEDAMRDDVKAVKDWLLCEFAEYLPPRMRRMAEAC